MKNVLILLSFLMIIFGCNPERPSDEQIDWQGHRGARGVYPENTWPAFKYAIDQNMTTLEMDVVITADNEVVVSHEPYLNHKICLDSTGNRIAESQEKEWNIYQMTYEELQKCDCGSIQNPDFPDQKQVSSPKPLLKDVLFNTVSYSEEKKKPLPNLNVEIKYEDALSKQYFPSIKKFNALVYDVLSLEYPKEKWNIQSFDFDVLKSFRNSYPTVDLAALVYKSGEWKEQFDELGFTPEIYSPNFQLVDHKMVSELHEKGVKIIPWTVNTEKDAVRLLKLGVDGIITDYPELAEKFRNNP